MYVCRIGDICSVSKRNMYNHVTMHNMQIINIKVASYSQEHPCSHCKLNGTQKHLVCKKVRSQSEAMCKQAGAAKN